MTRRASLVAALLAIGLSGVAAEETGEGAAAKTANGPGARMDYGPVVSYFVLSPPARKEVVYKGISIKLGADAGVCFDAETLRYAAGWTGGFVDMTKSTPAVTGQGSGMAAITGTARFASHTGPGWAFRGEFKDPRSGGLGNLPSEWGRYRGLYRHGDQAVLAYTVGDCEVRELPGLAEAAGNAVFLRTFQLGTTAFPQSLLACEVDGASGGVGPRSSAVPGTAASAPADDSLAVLDRNLQGQDGVTAVGISSAPKGTMLDVAAGRIVVKLPAQTVPTRFTLAIWSGPRSGLSAFASAIAALTVADPDALCKGGAPRWPTVVGARSKLGADDGPYAVDSIGLPVTNPWNSWIRPTGFDFLPDGRVALCTFGGDVWIGSGISDTLAQVSWRRFASGLFEPLGLKVSDGAIHVLGRDQITRLHDLDNDGEADFYENFFNATLGYHDYHDFSFDLQTDKAGDFYFAKGGNRVPWDLPLHSCVFKIAKDGSSSEVFATGFRACNGMGMGPDGQLTVSDNQGHWIPACKINLVKKGGWYGYMADPRLAENKEFNKSDRGRFDPPLCWIPMPVDNSSGSEVWAGDKWGPLSGQMLHLSYGQSSLMEVMYEEIDGVPQGGVVQFPFKFESGAMRARVGPGDGQLYVCGIKGWQTNAGLDGCFQRVRYTGKPVHMPNRLHVTAKGIEIGFTTALDRASVLPDSFAIEQWNYRWTSNYGSDDYSVTDPARKGHDSLQLDSATLGADGTSILLGVPGLRPVMQMSIKYRLKAADGTLLSQTIFNTINVVPK